MATVWSLLHRADFFYILALQDRPYIPELTRYCGHFLELEELFYDINEYPSASHFLKMQGWPERFRLKIALGILEFFVDAPLFNPNDEFGADMLYLCSPIYDSFGYSFILDAKLLRFDSLLTARELQAKLSGRVCKSDRECGLTSQCVAKCVLNRCTRHLTRPQLVGFCAFLGKYLDESELIRAKRVEFDSLIRQCMSLENLFTSTGLRYGKADVLEEFARFSDRVFYLNYTVEYNLLTDKLKSLLWREIRMQSMPQRPKKRKIGKGNNKGFMIGRWDGLISFLREQKLRQWSSSIKKI